MAEVNKESPMLTTIQIQFRKFLTGEFNEALFELDDKAN